VTTNTTETVANVADQGRFDNWFDPMETKVRCSIETLAEEETETALSRPR
jgi:hypothetical protein